VGDARERALHIAVLQHDLLAAFVHRFLPGLTGPG
jgi:hypothetical protein